MSTTQAPAGWHPDPSDSSALRWWDGNAWTQHTQPRPAAQASASFAQTGGSAAHAYAPATQAGASFGQAYAPSPSPTAFTGKGVSRGSKGFMSANAQSLSTLAIVVLYLLIDLSTHIVIFGIIPVVWSLRSLQRKEQLAPLAILGAVVAVVVGFTVLSH